MLTPEERLKDIINKIQREGKADDSRVVHLVVRTRKLIEARGLKKKFPLINFFCNWVVHPKIDRSPEGWWILKQITDILIQNAQSEDMRTIIEGVSNTLAPKRLRNEFIELYKDHGLLTYFFDIDENWESFYNMLITEVRDTPITINTRMKKGKQTIELIETNTQDSFFQKPTEFWISGNLNEPLFWHVKVFVPEKDGEITIKSELKTML